MQASIAVALTRRHLNTSAFARDLMLVLGGALVLSLLAQLELRLPFSLITITGQTAGVLLVGAALGGKRALSSVGLYLLAGLCGAPVLAGWSFGPTHFAGPSGGYLIGFLPAAFVVGALVERGFDRTFGRCAFALACGAAIVLLCGAAWLARFVGLEQAIATGVLPFVLVDALKIALVALAMPALRKHV